jgi:hypothetical protein
VLFPFPFVEVSEMHDNTRRSTKRFIPAWLNRRSGLSLFQNRSVEGVPPFSGRLYLHLVSVVLPNIREQCYIS